VNIEVVLLQVYRYFFEVVERSKGNCQKNIKTFCGPLFDLACFKIQPLHTAFQDKLVIDNTLNRTSYFLPYKYLDAENSGFIK